MSICLAERAIYERKRRKNVIREAREHRLMVPWLKRLYPGISIEFGLFLDRLQKENPNARDLTTTGDFRRFMRLGKGTEYVFYLLPILLLILSVCVMFLGSQSETTFSLRIPLITPQSMEQSGESTTHTEEIESMTDTTGIESMTDTLESESMTNTSETESMTDTVEIEEIGNCEMVDPDTYANDAPQKVAQTALELTDEDIEEMLTALRSVPDVPQQPNKSTMDVEMDEDLREALELDVNHFIV